MSKPEPKTLQLNPADVETDDSLPKYYAPIQLISPPPLTDKEVADGKPLRLAARRKVLDMFNSLINEERGTKEIIKKVWDASTDKVRIQYQEKLNLFKIPQYLDLKKYIKTALVWWDNNIELSPRQVTTRDTKYDDVKANKIKAFEKAIKDKELTGEVKELRSEFVDRRSELMKLKMESTVTEKVAEKGILPATVPPIEVIIKKKEEKGFFKNLW